MTEPATAFPLAPLARFGTAFSWGFRRALASKKAKVTAALAAAIGFGIAWLSRESSHLPALDFWEALDTAYLAVGLPIVALAVVAGGYGEEIQDQTLVYHLVRPVSRATVFLARFASGALIGAFVGALLVVTGMLGAPLDVPLGATLKVAILAAFGVVTIGAVYYTLAAVFRRGVIAGLVYTFVGEGLFQFIPGSTRKLSLMFSIRSLFHHWTDEAFAPLSRDIAAAIEAVSRPVRPLVRGLEPAVEPWSSPTTALLTCLGVIAVAMLVGSRSISRRDFALKD